MTNSSPRSRYHPAAAFDPPKADLKPALPLPKVHVDDGMKPLQAEHGVTLGIGIPCIVSLQKKRARFKAFARYIGRLEGVSSRCTLDTANKIFSAKALGLASRLTNSRKKNSVSTRRMEAGKALGTFTFHLQV